MNNKEIQRTQVDKLIAAVRENIPTTHVGNKANIDWYDGQMWDFNFAIDYSEMIEEVINEYYPSLTTQKKYEIVETILDYITFADIEFSYRVKAEFDLDMSDTEELERLLANEGVTA